MKKGNSQSSPPARKGVAKVAATPEPAGALQASRGEENAAYLLRQVAERLGISLVAALRPFDQSPSVYRVLMALTRRNPVRMRDLIDLTLIETSVLSRTVARMKSQGLVSVSADPRDARSVVVEMTEAGTQLLQSMLPAVSAQYQWAIHDVPAEDLEMMRLTLARMLHNLKISPVK
ncbi:MAG: MarR family transcriptional regulator [Ramlibacter sp.]|nr:MarR family transcriptional regulator [Ramlibacter sp.]MDB5912077.1 MarR family transcriptional regulator [Ramlibacter sp.]